ncbi:MAG: hypothetical protein AAF355_14325 [Myxococcota bacterium]
MKSNRSRFSGARITLLFVLAMIAVLAFFMHNWFAAYWPSGPIIAVASMGDAEALVVRSDDRGHVHAVRTRVDGTGVWRMALFGLVDPQGIVIDDERVSFRVFTESRKRETHTFLRDVNQEEAEFVWRGALVRGAGDLRAPSAVHSGVHYVFTEGILTEGEGIEGFDPGKAPANSIDPSRTAARIPSTQVVALDRSDGSLRYVEPLSGVFVAHVVGRTLFVADKQGVWSRQFDEHARHMYGRGSICAFGQSVLWLDEEGALRRLPGGSVESAKFSEALGQVAARLDGCSRVASGSNDPVSADLLVRFRGAGGEGVYLARLSHSETSTPPELLLRWLVSLDDLLGIDPSTHPVPAGLDALPRELGSFLALREGNAVVSRDLASGRVVRRLPVSMKVAVLPQTDGTYLYEPGRLRRIRADSDETVSWEQPRGLKVPPLFVPSQLSARHIFLAVGTELLVLDRANLSKVAGNVVVLNSH